MKGFKYLLASLFWPLFVLTLSFKDVKRNGKLLFYSIWLCSAYYGLTYNFVEESGTDLSRYVENFRYFATLSISEFYQYLFFNEQQGKIVDYFEPIISFFCSRFSQDHRILISVYALIFGYFYSKNISYFISKIEMNLNFAKFLFIPMFFFIVGIWDFGGFRFWTAAHIMTFAVINIFYLNRKIFGLFLVLLSIFVHFSYVLFFIPFLITFLTRKFINIKILFILYFVTNLFHFVEIDFFNKYFSFLPENYESRTSGIATNDFAQLRESIQTERNWYVRYYEFFIRIPFIFIFLFLLSKFDKMKQSLKDNSWIFILFFGIFINLLSVIPLISRFNDVFFLFSSIALVKTIKLSTLLKTSYIYPVNAFLFLYVLVSFRILFLNMTFSFILPSPFYFILTLL